MCNQTCEECNSCTEVCTCTNPSWCKPKRCKSTVPAECITDLARYLHQNLLLDNCLYTTLEEVEGDIKVKLNINKACLCNTCSAGNCTPLPQVPTINTNKFNICGAEKATLSSNLSGVVTQWYNQNNELIGSGDILDVGSGTYYAKTLNNCGLSNMSNLITVTSSNCGQLYVANRSQIFNKQCTSGCTGTAVVFNKSYSSLLSQTHANELAQSDSSFASQGQTHANTNGQCICNYCDNFLSWNNPVITCNSNNTTTVNISVSGNAGRQVEFYNHSAPGNEPYNPNGWVVGTTLNSLQVTFNSDNSLKYFKARIQNCTEYIDGAIATCEAGVQTYVVSRSAQFTKAGCASNCTAQVLTYTKTYTSTISQQAAQDLANSDINFNSEGQTFANTNGQCLNCTSCTAPTLGSINGNTYIPIGGTHTYTLGGFTGSNVTHSWNISPTSGVILSGQNTSSLQVTYSTVGTYTITYTGTNTCGTVTKSITVNAYSSCTDPLPTVTLATNAATICGTQVSTVTASGCTGTVSWYQSNDTQINHNGNTYTVTGQAASVKAKCTNCRGTSNFSNTVNVSFTGACGTCTNPTATIAVDNPTCSGSSVNANGKIRLTSFSNANRFNIGASSTYAVAYPITGVNQILLESLSTTGTYTIRFFNGSDSCYTDVTATVTAPSCAGVSISNITLNPSC